MENAKFNVTEFFRKYSIITLGCVLYAFGVTAFLEAGDLASGGATGIALIISHLINMSGATGWNSGILVFIINVPMFILGWIYFGKNFFFSTLYTVGLSSALMWLFSLLLGEYLPFTENPLINAAAGGAVFGLGMGLIFRMGSSSGGTDIPVKILRKKYRHIQTGLISMVSDVIIVASSYFVYCDLEMLFYTIVSVVVFTLVFDWVLYGGNSAKMIYVITSPEKSSVICDRILHEVDSGATFIDAKGAYSGQDKKILLCAIKPFLYPKLRDVVHEEDKNAFIIVSSAKEIYGTGYQNPDDLV